VCFKRPDKLGFVGVSCFSGADVLEELCALQASVSAAREEGSPGEGRAALPKDTKSHFIVCAV